MPEELKYEHARFLVEKDGKQNNQRCLVTPENAYKIMNDEREKFDGEPVFMCPGHDYYGEKCSAKLFIKKSTIGTLFFSTNSQEDHVVGCRYRDYDKIRENKDGEKIGFSLKSFDCQPYIYNQNNTSKNGYLFTDEELYRHLTDSKILREYMEGEREFHHKYPPRNVLELAVRLLSSKPYNVTEDNKLVEDQILCKRTSDVFFKHLKNYPSGDCFLLAVQKSYGDILNEAKNVKDKHVIYMFSLYDRTHEAPVIEFVFPTKHEKNIVTELLSKKEEINKVTVEKSSKEKEIFKNQGYLVCAVYNRKFRKKFGESFKQVFSFLVYSSKKFIEFPTTTRMECDLEYVDCIARPKREEDNQPSLSLFE